MGLMLIFPVSQDETDRVEVSDESITLKSYGLPLIFWGYLVAVFALLFAMSIGIKGPMVKLYQTGDPLNKLIVIAALCVMILIPVVSLFFYFYEKLIFKSKNQLRITHRFFWIPVRTITHELKDYNSFEVNHFMDSPNVAKLQGVSELRGFENKGYFQLFFINKDGKKIFLDRHSRKADLIKIKDLLSQF